MTGTVRARFLRVSCSTLGAVVLVAWTAIPAGAGKPTPTKPYVATIAPDTVAAGSSPSFSLTLENLSDQQQIGSANLTPPSGFTLTGESSPFATISGNTLQLRDMALQAGSTLVVNFTGDVPCAATAGVWGFDVKQSNDFNGPPGNEFVMVAPSDLETPVVGTCHLGFLYQPQDAEKSAIISRTDLVPAAGAVEVEVLDGAGQRVTTSSATVTVGIDPGSPAPGAGAVLSGTRVAAASAGVASFANLSIDLKGRYKLLATSPGLTPASSDEFRIWDDGAVCVAGVECSVSQTGPFMRGDVRTTSLTAGKLVLNLDGDELSCGDSYRHAPQTMTFDAPGVTTPAGKTVTMTIDKREVNRVANNGAAHYQVCFESDVSFTPREGGDEVFKGLLPDCASRDPGAPCVKSKVKDRAGNVVITLIVPAGDPRCQ